MVLYIVFISALFHSSIMAESITITADPWCPYNCAQGSSLKGYLVEITELAFSKHNINVKYVILPWSRAIRSVFEGRNDAAIGVNKQEAPQLIFPTEEMGISKFVFYTKPTSNWQYTDITSLKDNSVGIIQDYSYGIFDKIIVAASKKEASKIQAVRSVNGLKQNIEKLQNNRIDVLVAESSVFNLYLLENNLQNDFRHAGIVSTDKIYIAFSPKNPKAEIYAQILSQELQELRATGQLIQILKKYNLQDWRNTMNTK